MGLAPENSLHRWPETFQFRAQSPSGAWENIFDTPSWQPVFFLCFHVELKAIYHNVDMEVALGTLSWVSGGQRIQSRGINYQWRRQSHHEHLELHTWEQGKVEVHLHPFGVSCPSGGSLLQPEARPTCCCWLYQVAQDGSWCSCLLCIPATLSLTVPSPLSNSRGLGPAPGADRALSLPGLYSSSFFSLFT